MILPRVLAALLFLLLVGCRQQTPIDQDTDIQTGFLDRRVSIGDTTFHFQVYLPSDYSPTESWPVIMSLHGSGERGSEGLKQTHVGLGRAIRFHPERWPAVVVFPQLPEGSNWNASTEAIGMRALDATLSEFSTDPDRIYLTGLSMGGYGSLYLSMRHPDRFAAVVPVCPTIGYGERYPFLAGSNPETALIGVASALTDQRLWIFHGEEDPVFPAAVSRQLVETLDSLGADARFTGFPDTGHNAWDPAYDSAELTDWLFQQRKSP